MASSPRHQFEPKATRERDRRVAKYQNELDEQAVRQSYRVICDPSWQVQSRWKGEWVTAFYCSNEASAYECLEKCVARTLKEQLMTPDERLASILR